MSNLLRKSKFLPTIDDWYPNHPRDTVECSLLELRDGKFRVCVWGADDYGVERDFLVQSDAEEMYNKLPNPVDKQWLNDNLFVYT